MKFIITHNSVYTPIGPNTEPVSKACNSYIWWHRKAMFSKIIRSKTSVSSFINVKYSLH